MNWKKIRFVLGIVLLLSLFQPNWLSVEDEQDYVVNAEQHFLLGPNDAVIAPESDVTFVSAEDFSLTFQSNGEVVETFTANLQDDGQYRLTLTFARGLTAVLRGQNTIGLVFTPDNPTLLTIQTRSLQAVLMMKTLFFIFGMLLVIGNWPSKKSEVTKHS